MIGARFKFFATGASFQQTSSFHSGVLDSINATGTVKWFNEAKGYGFISPDDKIGADGEHPSVIRLGVPVVALPPSSTLTIAFPVAMQCLFTNLRYKLPGPAFMMASG